MAADTRKQFLCSHLVSVQVAEREFTANLEGIWTEGASLDSDEALPEGTPLRITAGNVVFSGTVRACVADEAGHLVEVVFEPGSEWSPERFKPTHLTDPDIVLVRKLLGDMVPPKTT